MEAYRVEKRVSANGILHLEALPFREGEMVEVVILPIQNKPDTFRNLLRRSPMNGPKNITGIRIITNTSRYSDTFDGIPLKNAFRWALRLSLLLPP
jgi:hypothetical protein